MPINKIYENGEDTAYVIFRETYLYKKHEKEKLIILEGITTTNPTLTEKITKTLEEYQIKFEKTPFDVQPTSSIIMAKEDFYELMADIVKNMKK